MSYVCSYCKGSLSLKDKICPRCGAPVPPAVQPSLLPSSTYTTAQVQPQSRTLSIIALVLALVGAVLPALIVAFIAKGKEPNGRSIANAAIGVSIAYIGIWTLIIIISSASAALY